VGWVSLLQAEGRGMAGMAGTVRVVAQ
jgi:hypothetical protein